MFINHWHDMESITFKPTYRRTSSDLNEKKLNSKTYSLISKINFVLEIIVRNTLKFNKLTSPEEIFERYLAQNESTDAISDIITDLDIDQIKKICDAMCKTKGVLVKLSKNEENFYKLNYHDSF
jgi:hypothetical protein